MQLHEIGYKKQRATRIGRGGKRGKTGGRGQKGQKSRAGTSMRPAIRDLISRIPKKRGFANKPTSVEPVTISLSALKGLVGKEVTIEVLREAKIVAARWRGPVKVLANGAIAGKIDLKGIQASEGARAKIEAAGGSVA